MNITHVLVSDCFPLVLNQDGTAPYSSCLGVWVPVSEIQNGSGRDGFFPDLSTSDAAEIGLAIAMAWVIGFSFREIRRALSHIDKGD